jgi:nucleoside-diphosphate-sugar epimerase
VPLAKDKALFWSVNRDGMETVLDAALEAGVAKLIYTSSSAVFGVPASNPVTEDTVPSPAEDYGRAKLDGERLCRDFAQRGLDVTIIRPRTILGSGRLGIFQILFEWIYQGDNIPILGKGDNLYGPGPRSSTWAPSVSAPWARPWRPSAPSRGPAAR